MAARDVMFFLRLASSLCLFLIGQRLIGATGAAFALLSSLSFSHVLKHGESFRPDPILSFCFLFACCLLILRPGRIFAGAAAGVGLAFCVARMPRRSAVGLASVVIAFASLSSLDIAIRQVQNFSNPGRNLFPIHLPPDLIKTYAWLQANAGFRDVLLAPYGPSNWLPVYTDREATC